MPSRKFVGGKAKTPTETPKEERPQHYVYMEKSVTKNLENYNSAKVSVGITVQVNPTKEELKEIEATISVINDVLDTEMLRQIQEFEK